jgi:hypothetical protein
MLPTFPYKVSLHKENCNKNIATTLYISLEEIKGPSHEEILESIATRLSSDDAFHVLVPLH